MGERRHFNEPASLLFTRDFHELRRGRLERGGDCTIVYDPARIIPEGEPYRFGDPERQITGHLRFRDAGPVTDIILRSRVGLLNHVPKTFKADGPMLTATFRVPDDAQQIMAWFTYLCRDGTALYDSDYGRNHTFRFYDQLRLLDARIVTDPNALRATLTCRVETTADVETVIVRYHITNQPGPKEVERAMKPVGTDTTDDRRVWELAGELLPADAVVALDLIYYVNGNRHKETNQGQYFIAAPVRTAAAPVQ